MAALPDTENLNIPQQGGPTTFAYSISSNNPVIDTKSLNIPQQGGPAEFLYTISAAAGSNGAMMMGHYWGEPI